MSSYFYEYYPPSRPLDAKGGIKAQSRRGEFAGTWWAKRWVEALESFNIGARLARGRTYARRGQVLSIDVKKGLVAASVQGSRFSPYEVSIKVKRLTGPDWKRVAEAVSGQAFYGAKLLSGDMPREIEGLFDELGLSLFPRKSKDLQTSCSCPDWSNPCKHIAAVYYLLGEEFDRDPFLIFKLRGIDRKAFIALVSPQGVKGAGKKVQPTRVVEDEPLCTEPLPLDPRSFWDGGSLPLDLFGQVAAPPTPAALPKLLGSFPFWRGEMHFLDFLEDIYLRGSDRGMEVFISASR